MSRRHAITFLLLAAVGSMGSTTMDFSCAGSELAHLITNEMETVITAEPNPGYAGETVIFTATVTTEHAIDGYTWYVDGEFRSQDHATGKSNSLGIQFSTAGPHLVEVYVSAHVIADPGVTLLHPEKEDQAELTISVLEKEVDKPIVSLSVSTYVVAKYGTVDFTATWVSGGTPPYKYLWDRSDDTAAFYWGSSTYSPKFYTPGVCTITSVVQDSKFVNSDEYSVDITVTEN